jgi:uncharacterized cupin superfamily protein
MTEIIQRQATAPEKEQCQTWELWESGETERFEYHYEQDVQFVVQRGEAVIHSPANPPVSIAPGRHVTVRRGVSAVWHIASPVVNRYRYL